MIGFHWLLLPTFVLELVPVLEDLPTWTACVIAVIALRKREQKTPPAGSLTASAIRLDGAVNSHYVLTGTTIQPLIVQQPYVESAFQGIVD